MQNAPLRILSPTTRLIQFAVIVVERISVSAANVRLSFLTAARDTLPGNVSTAAEREADLVASVTK